MIPPELAATPHRTSAVEVARELAVLLAFSLAVAVTAGPLKLGLGIPGHAALYRLPVLLLAGCRRTPGFAVASAACGGVLAFGWAGFSGMNFAELLASAAVIEAFGLGRRKRVGLPLLLLTGLLAHIGKLLLKVVAALVAGMPLNRAGLPLDATLALYCSFGLMAGLTAYGLLLGYRRALRATSQGQTW